MTPVVSVVTVLGAADLVVTAMGPVLISAACVVETAAAASGVTASPSQVWIMTAVDSATVVIGPKTAVVCALGAQLLTRVVFVLEGALM